MLTIIIGAGRTGQAASDYLTAQGKDVLLYDDFHIPTSKTHYKTCQSLATASALLKHTERLVLSPAITLSHPLVVSAPPQVKIISEVDLALERYTGEIIAVTGTNGKSSVCTYIQHLLQKQGVESALAGNIGTPVTAVIADNPNYLVLELSSYQLEQSHLPPLAVAIFTNFSADHLHRHQTISNYFAAKSKIFQKCKLAISDHDIYLKLPQPKHLVLAEQVSDKFHYLIEKKLYQRKILLADLGLHLPKSDKHSLVNASMALLSVNYVTKTSISKLLPALTTSPQLPHRLQTFGTSKGQTLINDAKATNLSATLAALRAQDQPVLLIVGGRRKSSLLPLLAYRHKIASVFVFGKDGAQIYQELQAHLPCELFPDLATVVHSLKTRPSTTTVLFSPACATDDEFKDYAARGEYFCAQLSALSS